MLGKNPFKKVKTFHVKFSEFDEWIFINADNFGMDLKYAVTRIDSWTDVDDNVLHERDTHVILVNDDEVEEYKSLFEDVTGGDEDDIASVRVILMYLYSKKYIEEGYYYFIP